MDKHTTGMSSPQISAGSRTAPRSQGERSKTTVAALLESARELFVQDGYADTALDDVVARAGVTKGALYHHFESKQDLFRAVYEQEQQRLIEALTAVAAKQRGAWKVLQAACEAFLDSSLDPAVQRITLLDAPGALGWETMRAIENEGSLRMLKDGLRHAMGEGSIRRRPVDPLAHLLFGALCEAAMTIARSPDQPTAARQTRTELRRLLAALARY